MQFNWITVMSNANFTPNRTKPVRRHTNPFRFFLHAFVIQSKSLFLFHRCDVHPQHGTSIQKQSLFHRNIAIGSSNRKTLAQLNTQFIAWLLFLLCYWNIGFCISAYFHSNSHWIKHAFLWTSFFGMFANVFRINLPQLRTSR